MGGVGLAFYLVLAHQTAVDLFLDPCVDQKHADSVVAAVQQFRLVQTYFRMFLLKWFFMSIESKKTYNENYFLLFFRNPQVRSQSIVSSLLLVLPLWHRCYFQAYKVDYNLFFGTLMQRAPISL